MYLGSFVYPHEIISKFWLTPSIYLLVCPLVLTWPSSRASGLVLEPRPALWFWPLVLIYSSILIPSSWFPIPGLPLHCWRDVLRQEARFFWCAMAQISHRNVLYHSLEVLSWHRQLIPKVWGLTTDGQLHLIFLKKVMHLRSFRRPPLKYSQPAEFKEEHKQMLSLIDACLECRNDDPYFLLARAGNVTSKTLHCS